MKNKLNIKELELLLEKYYEGITSVDEEKQLKEMLSEKHLPKDFEADKAILGYFSEKKRTEIPTKLIPFIRWASIAAFLAIGLFCLKPLLANKQTNFAYINGEKVTNVDVIKKEALASIQVFSSSQNEVKESMRNLDTRSIVEEQLSLFIKSN